MKRTVGFHVPSGAYQHRIAVTLPSRDIFAPMAAGLGRPRRPRAPGGEARPAPRRRLPPGSRPIIVDANERQEPAHRSAINGKTFLGYMLRTAILGTFITRRTGLCSKISVQITA